MAQAVTAASAIHSTAAKGFQAEAQAYERGRPTFPPEAIAYLVDAAGLKDGASVVEVGAGTGKFTRLLAKLKIKLVAVEPVAAMREQFRAHVPESVPVVDGVAEKLPFENDSIDAIVCAQAFHWFDAEAACKEFHRVLKKPQPSSSKSVTQAAGGRLVLVWNRKDEDQGLAKALSEVVKSYETDTPRYAKGVWRKVFDDTKTSLFTPLTQKTLPSPPQKGDQNLVIDRIFSVSFMASLGASEKEKAKSQILSILDKFSKSPTTEFELPYSTDIFTCSVIAK